MSHHLGMGLVPRSIVTTVALLAGLSLGLTVIVWPAAVPPRDVTYTAGDMRLEGDFVVCGGTAITDPGIAALCAGAPPGLLLLGARPDTDDRSHWSGARASMEVPAEVITSALVAEVTVTWPVAAGRGIHGDAAGRVAMLTWDGVPIWTRRTRAGAEGGFSAADWFPVETTAVLTRSSRHVMTLHVPRGTVWDVSAVRVRFHAMPKTLRGLGYSPFRDCQSPWDPEGLTDADIAADLARIRHIANGIRTYSSRGVNGRVPVVARRFGLPVCAGAWIEPVLDAAHQPNPAAVRANKEELDALVDLATDPSLHSTVSCVIVGNESLLQTEERKVPLTPTLLVQYIETVKRRIAERRSDPVLVTTAEALGPVLDNGFRPVANAVDFLMLNLHPYWSPDPPPANEAVDRILVEVELARRSYPGKEIRIGEAGWPSAGPAHGRAVASLADQGAFFGTFLYKTAQSATPFYYFTFADERWKGATDGHFGILYTDRTGKHALQSVLGPFPTAAGNPTPVATAGASATVPAPTPWGTPGAPVDPSPTPMETGTPPFVVYDEDLFDGFDEDEKPPFIPSGWTGITRTLRFDACNEDNPYSGRRSLRFTFAGEPGDWAGIYLQRPPEGPGRDPGTGLDLSGATELRFAARGGEDGTRVQFQTGGLLGSHPDSVQPAVSTGVLALGKTWSEHVLDLRGRDTSAVVGAFGAVVNACDNHGRPVSFDVDRIRFTFGGERSTPTPTATPSGAYTFDLFRGTDENARHDVPSVFMGDTGDVTVDPCWSGDPLVPRVVRIRYEPQGRAPQPGCDPFCHWAAVSWRYPPNSWGDRPGGLDLRGARALVVRARGEKGGEWVSFSAGGVACADVANPLRDTLCPERRTIPATVRLDDQWRCYVIPLDAGQDLRNVVAGLTMAMSHLDMIPEPVNTILISDVRYVFNTTTLPVHAVLSSSGLAYGYRLADSGAARHDWHSLSPAELRINYSAAEPTGAVSVLSSEPSSRDLSAYRHIGVSLRGEKGGERVWLQVRDALGGHATVELPPLAVDWRHHQVELAELTGINATRLSTVASLVFQAGVPAETIYVRDLRYMPARPSAGCAVLPDEPRPSELWLPALVR